VPADPSSSIPAALARLAYAGPLRPAEPPHLLAYLATVHDPRRACGRRHPLVAILAMAAAAVLTDAPSVAAIAEWAADSPQPVRAAVGARREAPDGTVALSPTASAKPGAVEALPTRRHQETTWNTRSCPQSALLGG
jgi:DDE_Tnp_1-associated